QFTAQWWPKSCQPQGATGTGLP
ncbi:MAG: hypothetical protein QOE59_2068, partial [Actinomycetota bacterium]|nr:hypothetical protein [Actinomycetota bacterium]